LHTISAVEHRENLNKKICLIEIEQADHHMTKLRIFIGFADEKLRVAMILLLGQEHGMVVVGITDRLSGLLPQLEAVQPNVLLLEWELSAPLLGNLITDIRNLEHPLKIVFLSNNPDNEQEILAAGADYFIVKNTPPDRLLVILREHQSTLNEISNPK